MKLYKHSVSIYGMATRRKDAEKRIRSLSENIADNILRCLIYGRCNAYEHWIKDKLAPWLTLIGNIKVKPSNNRFDKEEYEELLFGIFGTSTADIQLMLEAFKVENRKRSEDYTDFEINRGLINKVYACVGDLSDHFSSWFSELKRNESVDQVDVVSSLHSILDEYC